MWQLRQDKPTRHKARGGWYLLDSYSDLEYSEDGEHIKFFPTRKEALEQRDKLRKTR